MHGILLNNYVDGCPPKEGVSDGERRTGRSCVANRFNIDNPMDILIFIG
jgi:hypothetical protein